MFAAHGMTFFEDDFWERLLERQRTKEVLLRY